MKDFVHVKTTNGESYIELQTRTVQFINEIKQLDAERIVVITHAGVIRSLWANYENIPLDKSFDLKLNYGHIIKLTL